MTRSTMNGRSERIRRFGAIERRQEVADKLMMNNTFQMAKIMHEQGNADKRVEFAHLGNGGRYTEDQKQYAFELIYESGVRATARILHIPRRTLQRWCRKQHVYVSRCPEWVYEWADRRNKRQEFWERKGYY